MAAPTPTFVILPSDVGNLGKKMRTQTRHVGADDVLEHIFGLVSLRSKKVFHYSPPTLAVTAAAQDATASGSFWLQNPAGSAVDLYIRQLILRFGSTNVASTTVTRIVLARFAFTGTPSGATVTAARRKSAEAPAADLRTAVTGMTVTLGATIASFVAPMMLAVSQTFTPPEQKWPGAHDPFEDDDIVLAPGEGAVLYQPDPGTAADPRRFTVDMRVEEVER